MEGQNIQLHFLDFDVEATYDVVEVRDGAGSNSTLLGEEGLPIMLFSIVLFSLLVFYLFLFFQLSSLGTMAPPMTCSQQPIR